MTSLPPPSNHLRRSSRPLLGLLGFGLLAWLAWSYRNSILQLLAGGNAGLLAISVMAGVAFTTAQALLFAHLIHKQGGQADKRSLMSAFLVSQPGKYVPGKVWSLALQSISMGNSVTLSNITIANIELAIISTIQVATLGLVLAYASSPLIACLILAFGLTGSTLATTFPLAKWLRQLAPRLSTAVGLTAASAKLQHLGAKHAFGLNASLTAMNLIASWLVLLATDPGTETVDLASVLSSIYLGTAASVLAVPVPAGLGVREAAAAVFGSLFHPSVPASAVITFALVFRCWQILVDIGCMVLGATIARKEAHAGN